MADSCMHAEEQLCSYIKFAQHQVCLIINPLPSHTVSHILRRQGSIYLSVESLSGHIYMYIYIYKCICQHTQPRHATLPACMHACMFFSSNVNEPNNSSRKVIIELFNSYAWVGKFEPLKARL